MLPFTIEQFFGVFRAYNQTVWPVQWLLAALALFALYLAARPNKWSSQAIAAVLGILWLWLGLAYHLAFFVAINSLAYVFAAVSVAGALAFLWFGVVQRRLRFELALQGRGRLGLVLVVFALAIYPAWATLAGNHFPEFPTFGLPCPTTIFTIGMLAFLVPPYPRLPLVAPVLWCFIGAQAAFLRGVPQDLGLPGAAVAGVFLLVRSSGAAKSQPATH